MIVFLPAPLLAFWIAVLESFTRQKELLSFVANFLPTPGLQMNLQFLGEKAGMDIQPWKQLSKFSFEKNADFSKLSQCLGAIGATLCCE